MAIVTPGVAPASALLATPPSPWLGEWCAFAARTRFSDLPAEVAQRTRLALLDCIGAIAAGAQEGEAHALAARMIWREGGGESPVIGYVGGARPGTAAFLNGTAGTMLELDEGNQYARGHPAIHVVPALLAAPRGDGAALLTALALGYEMGSRVGIASKLNVAMHPHGTWGTLGASVGVAKLHGATAGEFRSAINMAASLGLATSRNNMLEGGTVRNTYAGVSNMLGLTVWDLVRAGFAAERDGVATIFGQVSASDFQPEEMVKDLGTRWEVARNYFKRHAACRYTHGALDALAQILAKTGPLQPGQVQGIAVQTYVWAAQLDSPAAPNMLAAKFSIPFALATFIAHGAATVPAFRGPAREDPAIQALAARVTVDEEAAMTAQLPGLRPARVTLTLADGSAHVAEVTTNRGDTEDPFTEAEVRAKFQELTIPVYGRDRAAAIEEAVMGLGPHDEATALVDLLKP
ncbi:MmgE/PrpD family protein [Falsiroseomonas selenitidurans]|uniref:MmgE/PrpD family protein n=1 Tax=Falsiroseomonas selenitidurans TaxID=2716335 RepID=A0ABX1E4M1_9PROT|nr:MmgE/PrpD family protein [Falsiroseomonas selenitidurans]NKC30717.1 MmgE/PrpD family protein [Falsiroseomonas selenitidurans]